MLILVVEDELVLQQQLVKQIKTLGFAVMTAADGVEGKYYATEYPFDLAVIDLGLPKLDGIELITAVRSSGKSFPILILTARDRWQDKVEGLNSGADDYLTKPFSHEELLARINALLRRSKGWAQPVLTAGPIQLNTHTQDVEVDGVGVTLTAFEYKILEYLMYNSGRFIKKSELVEHLYDADSDHDLNVIEVLVGRLRRKLDPEKVLNPIETGRGSGYRLNLAKP